MIGQLTGKYLGKQLPFIIIEAAGVGYEVIVPMTTVYHLPDVGSLFTVYTHLNVREDAQELFGFHHLADRDLFRILIKVNGIGSKTAVTILSSMDAVTLKHCVLSEDVSMLTSIPGIGRKSAERMIVELKDKLVKWQPGSGGEAEANSIQLDQPSQESSPVDEAISALQSLGYKPQDAKKALKGLAATDLSVEALIKSALQNMLKKNS